jgi:beta-phosphoglucomutase
MRLEAVIFDLDGVITDTAECHYLAWKRLSDELSIPFDRERNQLLRGIGRIESLEIILRNGSATFTREETLQLAERKNAYYRDLIQHLTAKDILPGIGRFLQLLREGNIKCGLASASANAPAILRQLHISYLFDYVVIPPY